MLVISIILLSFSPLFIHWADSPGIIASFYRMLFALIFLLPIYLRHRRKKDVDNSNNKGNFQVLLPILAGVFSALDHSFWSSAINQTSVTNATLLNYISPLWVSIVAIIFLKEKYRNYYWLGLLLVFLGTASVLNLIDEGFNSFNFNGEGFALISSFFYAGYFLLSQKSRSFYSAFQHLFISLLSCCFTLGLIITSLRIPLFSYSFQTFITFLIAALFCQLLGYYCLTYALGKIPASIVSPSLALQPVMTAILAIPFAKQLLSIQQIIGSISVLLGVILINKSRIQNSKLIKPEI